MKEFRDVKIKQWVEARWNDVDDTDTNTVLSIINKYQVVVLLKWNIVSWKRKIRQNGLKWLDTGIIKLYITERICKTDRIMQYNRNIQNCQKCDTSYKFKTSQAFPHKYKEVY